MPITNAKNQGVTEQALEVVQQPLDGLWTAEEMTRKIEQITGGKVETWLSRSDGIARPERSGLRRPRMPAATLKLTLGGKRDQDSDAGWL